jgi:general secretion pathway protein G
MAVVGVLSAIAVPVYTDYITDSRNSAAIADIANIDSQIQRFRTLNGNPPATLAAANIVPPNDPWGNPYFYSCPSSRWDIHDKPLNDDYDISSMGPDGVTKPKISHADAHDDIIRANSGSYIGVASEY